MSWATLSSCEIIAWENSRLNGIKTYELCNTSAVLLATKWAIKPFWNWSFCEFIIYSCQVFMNMYERSLYVLVFELQRKIWRHNNYWSLHLSTQLKELRSSLRSKIIMPEKISILQMFCILCQSLFTVMVL